VAVEKLIPGGELVDMIHLSHMSAWKQYKLDKSELFKLNNMPPNVLKKMCPTKEKLKWREEDIADLTIIVDQYETAIKKIDPTQMCLATPQKPTDKRGTCLWDNSAEGAANQALGSFCEYSLIDRKQCEERFWVDALKQQKKIADKWYAYFDYLNPKVEKPLSYGQTFFLRFLTCDRNGKVGVPESNGTVGVVATSAARSAAENTKNCYLTSLGNHHDAPVSALSKPGSAQMAFFEPDDPLNEGKLVRFGDKGYLRLKHSKRQLVVDAANHEVVRPFDPAKDYFDMSRIMLVPGNIDRSGMPIHRDDHLAIKFLGPNHYLTRSIVGKGNVAVLSKKQDHRNHQAQHMAIEF
jgi:hypothetical protein